MKRWVCILILLGLITLSGCSFARDDMGEVLSIAFETRDLLNEMNDQESKEDVIQYVLDHKEELLSAIGKNDFASIESGGFVKGISKFNTYTEFYCGGAGVGPETRYAGFFYTAEDNKMAKNGMLYSNYLLNADGDTFEWVEKSGDNRFYVEKICDCFYYYEDEY